MPAVISNVFFVTPYFMLALKIMNGKDTSFLCFIIFLYYNVRARVCVEMLQVLLVCKFAFRFSVFSCFSSAVFVWVPSFFRPYTRVRIL